MWLRKRFCPVCLGGSIKCLGGFDREVLSWPRVYKSSISPNLIMAGNFLGHFLPMIHTCKFCDKYVTKTQSQGYSHKGLAREQPVLLLGPAQPEKFLGPKNVWVSGCIRLSIRRKQYSLRGHNVFCSSGCFLFFSIDLWGWWTQQVSKHAMYYAMDYFLFIFFQFSSVQLLSHVWLFTTPWTEAQGLLVHHHLLESMSIESVMPSNHLILCHPPSPPAFNLSQHQGLFQWVSSSHQVAKVLGFQPQHQSFQWTPRTLGWTGWISLQSKGLSRVFSNTAVQKHQFFGAQLSL